MNRRWDFSVEGQTCNRCGGKGLVFEQGDLHRSPGYIPCPGAYFQGHGYPTCVSGKLAFSKYDREHQVRLMKQYPPEMPKKPKRRKRRMIRVRYGAREFPL